ncbi:acyl transferase/acyl hydrolase/lysophospholipase [Trichococcus palustris]|uniref:Acyl transferase/acyl hydrolase/lysophospholipase n=1 Tax=Trichococcus palustris TaxID=140314 RepID=A0A143Y7B2_9LACT|nr:patatin-like phospholipase family protein [Trichococcus palustris]CZQ81775.1 acyl transferase/acyl hydrolase/lysophospholipase [Trichococcus palustris]SFK61785.1 NTE family protein [Trichococcus palustris]
MMELKKVDAVFEGGGIKGIGLVGAVSEIEKAGYKFENLVGTSAGAIVATLLAVGYKAEEIKNELLKLDYTDFKDKEFVDNFGPIGKGISIIFEYGIYEGDFFESWLNELLKKKGITTFKQIQTDYPEEQYKYKLQIVASDITDKKMLILPHDLKDFVDDIDQFSIAKAVRMSIGIPIFFEPVKLKDKNGRTHIIVDGGILSNYPIWLLDDTTTHNPKWPTFGFKLNEPVPRKITEGYKDDIDNPVKYLKALVSTMMEAHDKLHISNSKGDYARTIGIPTSITINNNTKEIKTAYFDITKEESLLLYKNGEDMAQKFLEIWDFDQYKKNYR